MDKSRVNDTKLHDQWQKMTISSDVMFGLVMEDKDILCELINRTLPELHVSKLKEITTQKGMAQSNLQREVRFDVYAKDELNRTFIVEMQVEDKHNLASRIRYYQEQVDGKILKPAVNYSKLDKYPVYIIMFCRFDYFKQNWAQYRFETVCVRDNKLKFGDKRVVVICNAKATSFETNERIRGFLQLMENEDVKGDPFATKILRKIEEIKKDNKKEEIMMQYELAIMDAKSIGEKDGINKAINIFEAIKELQKKQMSSRQIVKKVSADFDVNPDDVRRLMK